MLSRDFTIKSSCELLKKAGLTVFDVEIVDYHGGSIRIYSSENPQQISNRCRKQRGIKEV